MAERADPAKVDRLEVARETLARLFPGGALRWTNAQRIEDAIREIVRDELTSGDA